jgi:hypothetical protein
MARVERPPPARRAGQGKNIADDGLGLLVDAEDIAGDLAILKGA